MSEVNLTESCVIGASLTVFENFLHEHIPGSSFFEILTFHTCAYQGGGVRKASFSKKISYVLNE